MYINHGYFSGCLLHGHYRVFPNLTCQSCSLTCLMELGIDTLAHQSKCGAVKKADSLLSGRKK